MDNETQAIIKGIDRALLHLTPGNLTHRIPNIRQMLRMLETTIKQQSEKNSNDGANEPSDQ